MCIYCGTNKYRKIYESHYGKIPLDINGRTYDVHHLDGDRRNNSPENLIAMSIEEHYNIHYNQGDWLACHRLAKRINLSTEETSLLAKKAQSERVINGTHNFIGGELQKKRVDEGSHHFLGGKIQSNTNKKQWDNGTHALLGHNQKRIKEGTHNWLGTSENLRKIENGTHNFIQSWNCQFCGKSGKNSSLYKRWGHDNGRCLLPRNSVAKDSTLRKWLNLANAEIVELSRYDFIKRYNLKESSVCDLIKGRRKSLFNWVLL